MAKLVILSEGMTGRFHELSVDKTTIGRVDDNTFPIVDPSVSSHHCEILLQGQEVRVRDLGSTNGTFIEGEQITEGTLKPGQILRLGQIQLRLEAEGAQASRKPVDSTMVMQRGVKLNELETGGRPPGFDTANVGFAKKENKANRIFLIVGIVMGLIIVGLLIYAFMSAGNSAANR
ncbi:MAG TPA: FHA domain-containing protein [Verrucomicrobiota bacterium]|nr:FHA domain-containing protein [Verrucomicrobiota bacterium]